MYEADTVVIKATGTPTKILEVASDISKLYSTQVTEISKIKKNEADEFYHLYMTIDFRKSPPKEQTDVKVREVS